MAKEIEIKSVDLKYEGYRIKNDRTEKELLSSIAEIGIKEPLEGVEKEGELILLDGFKRYRCAKRLDIRQVPYRSISNDLATALIELIKPKKKLYMLEEGMIVDELKEVHGMTVNEIGSELGKSKSWVSMRIGLIQEMPKGVKQQIFEGRFSVYSYIYTIRKFMRMNTIKKEEIEEFINAVSSKNLSVRDIEYLINGYFKGPKEFKEQIKGGQVNWVIDQLKNIPKDSDMCSEYEKEKLKEFEIIKKYMEKIMSIDDKKLETKAFHAQANLISGRIISTLKIFKKVMEGIYDRTAKA